MPMMKSPTNVAPPPAPPMDAGPPPMPPGQGGSVDDAMAAEDQRLQAQVDAINAAAPVPEEAVPVKSLLMLQDQIHDFISKVNKTLGGQANLEPPMWEPPKGEKTWSAAMPTEIFGPLVVIAAAAIQVQGGKFAKKYGFDPTLLVSDAEIRVAGGRVRAMANDKKFMSAIAEDAQAVSGPGAEEPPGPGPGAPPAPGSPEDDILTQAAG